MSVIPAGSVGSAIPLTDTDLAAAARALGCNLAAVIAVCDIESDGSGFLPDHRPKILFEAREFHTLTNGRWDRAHPNISSPTWDRSLYGAAGAHQYERLAEAVSLNQAAALESASWGRFQVLGVNFSILDYPDIESFVGAMCESEVHHLDAFVSFCRYHKQDRALAIRDWHTFALGYNGSGQVDHYVAALRDAYARARLLPPPPPPVIVTPLVRGMSGPPVIELQRLLVRWGYPVAIDGDFGPQTATIVVAFQRAHNLSADGIVGPATLAALAAGP